jgi:putative aminopeptidase FrvX
MLLLFKELKYMYNLSYLQSIAKEIINIDSPSGYSNNIRAFLHNELKKLGYESRENKKGNVLVSVKGKNDYTIGLSAHVDTIGAIVKGITGSGQLLFSPLGGPQLNTLDGEYCRIHTRNNKVYTGTFLSSSPSSHVYSDANSKPRNDSTMEIRIDELVKSKQDVLNLGIYHGDIICIDPKFEITPSGFVKSRFLDDKICVAILLTYLKYLKDNNITLENNLEIIFSTYEEVGHGGSNMPNVDELIAIDMACVGLFLDGSETKVTICCKDSSGPYDYNMITALSNICKEQNIDFAIDVYPYYGSDASASLRAGNDIKAALIGPGVHASHGMERTHLIGLENTLKLLIAYIK